MLTDLVEVRARTLGVLSSSLHTNFQAKPLTTSRYFSNEIIDLHRPPEPLPYLKCLSDTEIDAELVRQKSNSVDTAFLLSMQAYKSTILPEDANLLDYAANETEIKPVTSMKMYIFCILCHSHICICPCQSR